MLLKEIFDQLTSGELSQLSIGGQEAGQITEANYSKVLSHVTLGLNALYKRFPLKEGTVIVLFNQDQTVYPMISKYAVSNTASNVAFKHIQDSINSPFINDILKIEKAVTEGGFELSLNDASNPYSLVTRTTTSLTVPIEIVNKDVGIPENLLTDSIQLTYRANHPKIEPEDLDPELVEVELPDSYLEALLYFVASRVNNPIGMTGEFNAGNNYASKYEMVCQQLEQYNLKTDQGSQNTRLISKGWV